MRRISFPFHKLLNWSKTHGRQSLPWRQYFALSPKDLSYHVWLSEILLQQTQVDRVVGYYSDILTHFPTVESLSVTSYEDFFPHYQGLGYYSRARNMLRTAKIVAEDHDGIFPNDTKKLVKLPGVGPYTAAAIRAFVYDEPVLSFDTNLEKIFSRYYHGSRFHRLSREEKTQIERDFQTTGISGREMNAAFMDFGSLVSLNTNPPPLLQKVGDPPRREGGAGNESNEGEGEKDYPLAGCRWFETKGTLEVQEKKKKLIFPTRDASIRVVLHENHRVYYSLNETKYRPFELPPTEGDIRHHVQEYFRTNYGLELSVRPVHDKFFEDDKPFVVCNAQVQKGKVLFAEYRKED